MLPPHVIQIAASRLQRQTGKGGLGQPCESGVALTPVPPLEVLNKSPCHAPKVELSSKAKA